MDCSPILGWLVLTNYRSPVRVQHSISPALVSLFFSHCYQSTQDRALPTTQPFCYSVNSFFISRASRVLRKLCFFGACMYIAALNCKHSFSLLVWRCNCSFFFTFVFPGKVLLYPFVCTNLKLPARGGSTIIIVKWEIHHRCQWVCVWHRSVCGWWKISAPVHAHPVKMLTNYNVTAVPCQCILRFSH